LCEYQRETTATNFDVKSYLPYDGRKNINVSEKQNKILS